MQDFRKGGSFEADLKYLPENFKLSSRNLYENEILLPEMVVRVTPLNPIWICP
jgi:hypothetical protein